MWVRRVQVRKATGVELLSEFLLSRILEHLKRYHANSMDETGIQMRGSTQRMRRIPSVLAVYVGAFFGQGNAEPKN